MGWGKGWTILILCAFTEKSDFYGGGGVTTNQYRRIA